MSTSTVKPSRSTQVSSLFWLVLGSAVGAVRASCQEEAGFDIRHYSGSLTWREGFLLLGLAVACACTWILLRRTLERWKWARRSVRFWWPTLMVGWAWLTTISTSRSVEGAWSEALDLFNFGFFLVNLPAVVATGVIGGAIQELVAFRYPPDWILGLVFWVTWYLIVAYVDTWNRNSEPVSFRITPNQPPKV